MTHRPHLVPVDDEPVPGRWSFVRLALLGLGVGTMVLGVVVGVTSVPDEQWPSVALWLAGGVAVHDAVLAPLAVVLGLVVLPRVPPAWRPALRGAALGAAVLAVVAVAVVAGAAGRRNPSVVPRDPATSVAVSLAVLVVAVVLGGITLQVVAARRRSAVARRSPPPASGPLEE